MKNDFDIAAKNYDKVFSFSEIGKAQRNRVYQYLDKHILQQEKLNILELNCGTGEDAIYFSEKGHHVVATDISNEMIRIASNKNSKIQFQQQDINTITSETFSEKFDFIFSNFGGLNCISKQQLHSFLKVSAKLLNQNGKLALVIMPKKCLWERVYFILKGQFENAFRRNTNESVFANVDGVTVPTWYLNPKDIVTLARESYKAKLIKPIGICIPPSYLEPFFTNKKGFLKLLIKTESLFSNRFWAKYADHYLITLQKK